MTKDTALDLALEALENSVDLVREDAYNAEKLYGNYPSRQGKVAGLKVLADDHEKAITAIKQALAAPVQEPVAFKQFLSDVHTAAGLVTYGKQCKALGERLGEGVMRYMATPPAAQPTVPLTDEQIDAAIKAWFETDIVAGRQPFSKRMRAAFAAAHDITEKGGAS